MPNLHDGYPTSGSPTDSLDPLPDSETSDDRPGSISTSYADYASQSWSANASAQRGYENAYGSYLRTANVAQAAHLSEIAAAAHRYASAAAASTEDDLPGYGQAYADYVSAVAEAGDKARKTAAQAWRAYIEQADRIAGEHRTRQKEIDESFTRRAADSRPQSAWSSTGTVWMAAAPMWWNAAAE